MRINCCEEHIELGLDIIVDECGAIPLMEKLSTDEELSTVCEYCQNKALYKVFSEK